MWETIDNNNKDQTDDGTQSNIDTSDDSEEQNYDGLTPVQHDFSTDEDSEGNYYDLNDPKVIKTV